MDIYWTLVVFDKLIQTWLQCFETCVDICPLSTFLKHDTNSPQGTALSVALWSKVIKYKVFRSGNLSLPVINKKYILLSTDPLTPINLQHTCTSLDICWHTTKKIKSIHSINSRARWPSLCKKLEITKEQHQKKAPLQKSKESCTSWTCVILKCDVTILKLKS